MQIPVPAFLPQIQTRCLWLGGLAFVAVTAIAQTPPPVPPRPVPVIPQRPAEPPAPKTPDTFTLTQSTAATSAPAWKAEVLGKLSSLADIPDWSKLAKLAKTMTGEEFDAAFNTYYADDRHTPPPWQRDALGITVPTGTGDGVSERVDFRAAAEPAAKPVRTWRTIEELPPLEGRPPLSDLRIALDPGHIGGSFARVEERFLTFNPQDPKEFIAEGDHVLTVAKLLKAKLEPLGAKVFLVREDSAPVTTLRPNDFRNQAMQNLIAKGVQNPPEGYNPAMGPLKMNTIQWESEKLFYRTAEIHSRAKKVNGQLQPDFVVCLHLNAESWGDAAQPQYTPNNHMHLLINGCYAADELVLQDVRYMMLRRLFLRMHETEMPLAESVAKVLAQKSGLPPFVYITPNARLVSETGYVYARNLLANRIYDCPVIYLEPYVMNNEDTYRRLLMGPYEGRTLFNGKLRASIYQEYANSVAEGIVNHYRSKRK